MSCYSVKLFNGKFYFDYMEFARNAKDAKAKAKEKTKDKPRTVVVSARKIS